MHILIFGATGGTGKQLVLQGLAQGHGITAFVRNPSLLQIQHTHLRVVKGSIVADSDLDSAMKGQNAVISALGNKTKKVLLKSNTTISEGLKRILEAMERNKVKRLVFLSSFGVSEHIFLPEKLFIRIVLKNIFADIPLQEKLIKESDREWTIIRPARLTNGVKSGNYTIGEDVPIGPFSHISRSDVASFLLTCIDASEYNRKIITMRS